LSQTLLGIGFLLSKNGGNMEKEKRIPVEVYSRVVGYFRPVNQWNRGKQEEFSDRLMYFPEQVEEKIYA